MTKKLHILVVDKDPTNRTHVREVLDKLGVDCTTCSTNNESVTSFRRGNYDGVILDGEQDTCISFMTAAAACNKTDVPIIFYSGSSKKAQYKKLWDEGYFVIRNNELPSTLSTFVELIQQRQHTIGFNNGSRSNHA